MILPEHATHGHDEAAAHSACTMHACDFCPPRAPLENRAYFSRAGEREIVETNLHKVRMKIHQGVTGMGESRLQ